MNADTPRTNAELMLCSDGTIAVPASLARIMEREIAVLTKCHEDNCRSISQLANELGQSRDAERLARVQLDAVRAERDKLRGYYHGIVAELGDDLALKCIRDLLAEVERLRNIGCVETLLRAETAEREVERLKKDRDGWKAKHWKAHEDFQRLFETCKELQDRAERAEAILGKLQSLHGCSQEMVVHWCEHAHKRSYELVNAQAELAKLRGFYNEIVAECGHDLIVREYRQRGELLQQEANRRKDARRELAKEREALRLERARLDWLNDVSGMDWFSNCDYGAATRDAIDAAMVATREAIDAAMKEDV